MALPPLTEQQHQHILALHPVGVAAPPAHTCRRQCDGCHTLENCVPDTRQLGDLLLCDDCYTTHWTSLTGGRP